MKKYLIILIFAISAFCCSKKNDRIMGYTWVVKEGFYNGEKINFQNNYSIEILDKYNDQLNGNPKLYFSEKGKVRLPGIDSKDIYANWYIVNEKLIIVLDSAKYNYIHRKIDSSEISNKDALGNDLGITKEEAITKSIEFTNKNPLKTNEFDAQMKIYGNHFKYEIKDEILTLESGTTKIIAVRDKTAQNIVNEFK